MATKAKLRVRPTARVKKLMIQGLPKRKPTRKERLQLARTMKSSKRTPTRRAKMRWRVKDYRTGGKQYGGWS